MVKIAAKKEKAIGLRLQAKGTPPKAYSLQPEASSDCMI
jgi:hypothetical protein